MKGLNKRVSISFLSVVVLLLLSGLISFVELKTLSQDTSNILEANDRHMMVMRETFQSLQSQNASFVNMVAFDSSEYDSICNKNILKLERSFDKIHKNSPENPLLDSLSSDISQLRTLVWECSNNKLVDSLPNIRIAYQEAYSSIFNRLESNLYDYTTAAQMSLEPRAEELRRNAYRAVTPVLISLAVMIAVVLMLFYFVMLYVVRPIIKMNKALGDYLTFRLPFAIKDDCRDEMLELREKIETMILQSKSQKN